MPVAVETIFAFAVGLCCGSFANVLIHRLPRGMQIVRGRSSCPDCRAPIAWRDNLPVLSWILLDGRCRQCRLRIPMRYPIIELAMGLLALAVQSRLGMTVAAIWTFIFLGLLLVIAIIDATHFIIPHTLTSGGLIVGLALAPLVGPGFAAAVRGALLGGAVILFIDQIYRRLRGHAGMGGGDAMLLAMIGAYLGPWGALATLGLGSGTGAAMTLLRSQGRPNPAERIPFGPFLAVGAAIVTLCSDAPWRWPSSLLGGG